MEAERGAAEPNKVGDVVRIGYREERSNLKSVQRPVAYTAIKRENVDPNHVNGIDGKAIDLDILSTHHHLPNSQGRDLNLNCTGLTLWLGAENMCDYLLKIGCAKLKGLHVLELGCGLGLGLAGICASKLVGRTGKVVLTDMDTDVLAAVEANISTNADCGVDAPCSTWRLPCGGDPAKERNMLQSCGVARFDLILATDVICEGDGSIGGLSQVRPFMETVSRLLAPNGGVFVLAFTKSRLVSEDLILEEADQNGLAGAIVDGYHYDIFGLPFPALHYPLC
jgi:SAM-dependent methyltransferase